MKTKFGSKHLNILVTGGAGFIGSYLVDNLLSKDHKVSILDNLSNGTLDNLSFASHESGFNFVKGDVLNNSDCVKNSKGIDVVYHLACLGVRHSIHSPLDNHKVNARGALNMLEASKENKIKKFFYISTSEVYGGVETFPIKEESLALPFTVYGASKLAGEHYTNAYGRCYGMDTTILRIFNNYGPRAHYEGDAGELIPRAIVSILSDKQPVIFGNGFNTRDFFYVKDTARALSELLGIEGLSGMTINIGEGAERTIRSVIEKILVLMKKENIGIHYLENRPADVPRLWADVRKFLGITHFKACYSFEEGLKETIAYYTDLYENNKIKLDFKEKNWEK